MALGETLGSETLGVGAIVHRGIEALKQCGTGRWCTVAIKALKHWGTGRWFTWALL